MEIRQRNKGKCCKCKLDLNKEDDKYCSLSICSYAKEIINAEYMCKFCYDGHSDIVYKNTIINKSISDYFRDCIIGWKKRSFMVNRQLIPEYKKFYGSRIEGAIHHFNNSFKSLLLKAFKDTNIEIKDDLSKYQENELKTVSERFTGLHNLEIGLFMPKDDHFDFHKKYSTTHFNKDNLIEYLSRKYGKDSEILNMSLDIMNSKHTDKSNFYKYKSSTYNQELERLKNKILDHNK